VTYGFEFQGVNHYRWKYWLETARTEDAYFAGNATYDEGRANITDRFRDIGSDESEPYDGGVVWFVYLDNTSYKSNDFNINGWRKDPAEEFYKPVMMPHPLVQKPMETLATLNWEYQGEDFVGEKFDTRRLAYEYKLTGFEEAGFEPYEEVTIYIDPDTGYVLNWFSEKLDSLPEPGLSDLYGEFLITDHGDQSITVESPVEDEENR